MSVGGQIHDTGGNVEHLSEYGKLQRDINELVSDQVVKICLTLGLGLLLVGSFLLYIGNQTISGITTIFTGSVIVQTPRLIGCTRYIRGMSSRSIWWMLRSDSNATLIFGTAFFIPGGLIACGIGAVTLTLTGSALSLAFPFIFGLVSLPFLYLFYIHYDELKITYSDVREVASFLRTK